MPSTPSANATRQQRASSVEYSEFQIETLQQQQPYRRRCCFPLCRQAPVRCIPLITLSAGLSLLCSITFFSVTGYLIYHTVERSFSLFIMSVLFFAECLGFGKYFIDILMLRRDEFAWHSKRIWVPFFDSYIIALAITASTTLLPCGMLGDLWNQMYLLSDDAYALVVICAATTLLKLLSASTLTGIHVHRVLGLHDHFETVPDYNNYPFNRTIRPTAPLEDDD